MEKKPFSADRWQASVANWQPHDDSIYLTTIDAHAAGEPLRIVVAGFPAMPSQSVLANRRYLRDNLDCLREILMWEPRGHADMYGCLLLPPDPLAEDPADFGVLFLHNQGYSSMCGHGIIALTTTAIEVGFIAAGQEVVQIDSPAGRITAWPEVREGRVKRVRFENVISFAEALDQSVITPGWGEVKYDLAYGGAYYAYVDACQLGLALEPENVGRLISAGREIKQSIADSCEITHPLHEDLSFLYGVIFVGSAINLQHHSRNVCVFANGEVDRSPTGTGVSGRAAIHFARGEIQLGQEIVIESILGTTFGVTASRQSSLGGQQGIVPIVSGSAFITGRHEWVVRKDDPLGHGFFLR